MVTSLGRPVERSVGSPSDQGDARLLGRALRFGLERFRPPADRVQKDMAIETAGRQAIKENPVTVARAIGPAMRTFEGKLGVADLNQIAFGVAFPP